MSGKVRIRHGVTGRYLSVFDTGLLWMPQQRDEADTFSRMVGVMLADAVNSVAEAFPTFNKIGPAVIEETGTDAPSRLTASQPKPLTAFSKEAQ